jgi:glycosyltransferase involved in cell wall biosynthesis
MPRISIGLPVWNGEDYLADCLDNLASQTFEDFEVIISDNNSDDCTHDIAQSMALRDRRFRVIRQDHNLGAAPNYNLVFAEATAPYFKWVAHDDLMTSNFLETAYRVLEQRQDVVLAHSKTQLIGRDGRALFEDDVDLFVDWAGTLRSVRPAKDRAVQNTAFERFRGITNFTTRAFDIFGLMRTEVINRTHLHRSFYGSDITLLAEIALYGKFYEHPEVQFFKREFAGQSRSLKTKDDQARWIDSSKKGDSRFDFARNTRALWAAVSTSPLSTAEKLRCYRFLIGRLNWKGPMKVFGVDTTKRKKIPSGARIFDIRTCGQNEQSRARSA